MKKDIISCFLIATVLFAMGGVNILGRINVLEPVQAGDELELFVNVNNPTEKDMDDMSVKAIFFDLGEYLVGSEFDLDDGETVGLRLLFDIPSNAPKGDHLVKIVASNDDVYDSKFIYVRVI